MDKYYVKINNDNYDMVSESEDNSQDMKDQGYIEVTATQFDGLFNLYAAVSTNVISYLDVLRVLNIDEEEDI